MLQTPSRLLAGDVKVVLKWSDYSWFLNPLIHTHTLICVILFIKKRNASSVLKAKITIGRFRRYFGMHIYREGRGNVRDIMHTSTLLLNKTASEQRWGTVDKNLLGISHNKHPITQPDTYSSYSYLHSVT